MSDTRIIDVARKVSGYLESRYPVRVEPGELLSAAWEGASRYPDHANAAARNACIQYLRNRDGRIRTDRGKLSRRTRVLSQILPADDGGESPTDWHPPARPDRPTLLALWIEAAPLRANWSWRVRLTVYLYTVEGLSLAEIAALWQVSAARMAEIVAKVIPVDCRRRAPVSLNAVRRCYAEGMNDRQMAAALGCCYDTARSARVRLGLPAARHQSRKTVEAAA